MYDRQANEGVLTGLISVFGPLSGFVEEGFIFCVHGTVPTVHSLWYTHCIHIGTSADEFWKSFEVSRPF